MKRLVDEALEEGKSGYVCEHGTVHELVVDEDAPMSVQGAYKVMMADLVRQRIEAQGGVVTDDVPEVPSWGLSELPEA